jgi:hypothetical protein
MLQLSAPVFSFWASSTSYRETQVISPKDGIVTYLEDLLDGRHGKLLVEGVEGGRASTPVLGLTIGSVVLLNTFLLLVDGVLDGLGPLIL